MRMVTAAGLQLSFTDDERADIQATSDLVADAARAGANIILPPELFQGHYFCRYEREDLFERARPLSDSPPVLAMQKVAKQTGTYIPASFFERDGVHHYNSMAMIRPDGEIDGVYRKSHIPDGPGYEEKFYFRPGNTGFKVWDTSFGKIGVGICWDQWFPETARAMVLMGAELLFYPTAIGSEPEEPDLDTAAMWKRAMTGHAVSNTCPVVAANRTGTEDGQTFYGSSFIVDEYGDTRDELDRMETGFVCRAFDLDVVRGHRASFGFFRDRRPDLYGRLSKDV
ncbi:nitrilase-related carbon-nitrogen hydrolase [Pacificimonas flava]|uniref:N-carbamoylputrescine amidase n=1 Tax=Pacificimonas flava TaxID=1234595 RepID=M2U2J0_9SPHN|nr:nitrilase-related carbon-nitrogen hydrolase [Pacificimonas flava]EMD82192.1 N-carbamoylputrescine amidase [Pacificimonas flava]MBB5280330.1 N-carbamoylputrescine amidase [Pacificimonas flava]